MKNYLTWFSLLMLITGGCEEWEFPQKFPVVFTEEVRNISDSGAELLGIVMSTSSTQPITSYGFVWSDSSMPTITSSRVLLSDPITVGIFSHSISSGLVTGETYYVRTYIQTEGIIVYGNQVRFVSK